MAVIWLLMLALTFAQEDFWYQRDFPKEEFAQRWAKVFEKLGTEAVYGRKTFIYELRIPY
jgi:hypothetical protein